MLAAAQRGVTRSIFRKHAGTAFCRGRNDAFVRRQALTGDAFAEVHPSRRLSAAADTKVDISKMPASNAYWFMIGTQLQWRSSMQARIASRNAAVIAPGACREVQ